MKVSNQSRKLSGRLGRSDHFPGSTDAKIALEPRAPEFPDQSQRADEHDDEGCFPDRESRTLFMSVDAVCTPFCDRIRCQGVLPFASRFGR